MQEHKQHGSKSEPEKGSEMETEPYRVTADRPIFNALLYGDPGSGKTTLAASCQDHPDMADVMFANIEGGLLSVAHRGDIHAVDIRSTEELHTLFMEVVEGQFSSVQTVVLDSLSEMQTINLEAIVAEAMVSGKHQSRSGRKRSIDDIWQEDYGKSTVQLKKLVRWWKNAPVNLIVTALAKHVYPKIPEGTDISQLDPLIVLPLLTAKLCTSVMGYMDFVWYCRQDPEDGTYQLLTNTDGIYKAKTRGPNFQKAVGQVIQLDLAKMMMPQIYDTYVQSESSQTAKKSRKRRPTKRKRAS